MERKNNLPNGEDIMARQQKCAHCGSTAYCVSTKSEADILTKRYFTCSNQPSCGAQFVMIESLSHFTYKPEMSSDIESIRFLFNTISEKDKNILLGEFKATNQVQIAMNFIESLPSEQQQAVISNIQYDKIAC